jgi:hypothetical protein
MYFAFCITFFLQSKKTKSLPLHKKRNHHANSIFSILAIIGRHSAGFCATVRDIPTLNPARLPPMGQQHRGRIFKVAAE